jgi:hypothetical protein
VASKFSSLTGELDKVHELLQLGFAAQAKTRYMQYEIELRNLEVAYFLFEPKQRCGASTLRA